LLDEGVAFSPAGPRKLNPKVWLNVYAVFHASCHRLYLNQTTVFVAVITSLMNAVGIGLL
jgi:hypothetical protein